MSIIKPWHSPDVRESIAGTPKQWLEPELRRRILDQRGSEGYGIDSDLQADIDSLNTGGGGGGYVAKAFSTDGASFLDIEALTSSDSSLFTFATFFRMPALTPLSQNHALIDFYPAGEEDTISIQDNGGITLQFDRLGGGNYFVATDAGIFIPDTNWHSLVVSFDLNHPVGSKRGAIILDRVLVSTSYIDTSPGAFVFHFSGAKVGIPDTTEDWPVLTATSLSVYQAYPGVSIVQSDNTILTADLNNFVTAGNKPVDPAVAIAAYGTPAILVTGDVNDLTNHGTGGAIVVTGTPTDATPP